MQCNQPDDDDDDDVASSSIFKSFAFRTRWQKQQQLGDVNDEEDVDEIFKRVSIKILKVEQILQVKFNDWTR
jgi:hypothetical protein